MHIEYVQKDAQPQCFPFRSSYAQYFSDLAVGRRNHQALALGNAAMRIAEEPQKKYRQQNWHNGPRPAAKKDVQERGHDQQGDSVKISVTNHKWGAATKLLSL